MSTEFVAEEFLLPPATTLRSVSSQYSRCCFESFLLSFTPEKRGAGGKPPPAKIATPPTQTGPAKGPRPTSSMPTIYFIFDTFTAFFRNAFQFRDLKFFFLKFFHAF